MSRRRTSPYPGGWVDEGPAAVVSHTGRHDPRPAVTIADMTPILVGTVLSITRDKAADDAHAKADAKLRQRFSIRPENRFEVPLRADARRQRYDNAPRCGVMMRYAKEPCARLAGHKREHLTASKLENANLSRRSPRKAA